MYRNRERSFSCLCSDQDLVWKPFTDNSPKLKSKTVEQKGIEDSVEEEIGVDAFDLNKFCGAVDENEHSVGCGFPPDRLPNPMRASQPLIPFEGEFENDIEQLKSLGLPLGFLPSPFDLDRVRQRKTCTRKACFNLRFLGIFKHSIHTYKAFETSKRTRRSLRS